LAPGHGVLRRGQGLRTGGIGLATAAVRQEIIKLMPTDILALLIEERDKVNRAIEALQGPAKRRSRPPKNALMATTVSTAPKPDRRKRAHTIARRKLQAKRMRAYWAAKRKAEAKSAGKPKKTANAA
jgi:hypothetical protein